MKYCLSGTTFLLTGTHTFIYNILSIKNYLLLNTFFFLFLLHFKSGFNRGSAVPVNMVQEKSVNLYPSYKDTQIRKDGMIGQSKQFSKTSVFSTGI